MPPMDNQQQNNSQHRQPRGGRGGQRQNSPNYNNGNYAADDAGAQASGSQQPQFITHTNNQIYNSNNNNNNNNNKNGRSTNHNQGGNRGGRSRPQQPVRNRYQTTQQAVQNSINQTAAQVQGEILAEKEMAKEDKEEEKAKREAEKTAAEAKAKKIKDDHYQHTLRYMNRIQGNTFSARIKTGKPTADIYFSRTVFDYDKLFAHNFPMVVALALGVAIHFGIRKLLTHFWKLEASWLKTCDYNLLTAHQQFYFDNHWYLIIFPILICFISIYSLLYSFDSFSNFFMKVEDEYKTKTVHHYKEKITFKGQFPNLCPNLDDDDFRSDFAKNSELKHQNPLLYTVRLKRKAFVLLPYDDPNARLIEGSFGSYHELKSVDMIISAEQLVQLGSQNVVNLNVSEDVIIERLNSQNNRVTTVNIDKYSQLSGEDINFNTLKVALVMAISKYDRLN